MVTESKASDLLPHWPAVPSAPSPQGLQHLRPEVILRQQPQPCPHCLTKSQQGSGTAHCGNLLPPCIRAKDLDLQFPALGATRPRRDDRGSRHNQGKAIEGAAPRQGATLKRGSSSNAGRRGPRLGPGCPQPLHPPPPRQAERLTVAAARFQRPAAAAAHWPTPPSGGQWEAAASGAARGGREECRVRTERPAARRASRACPAGYPLRPCPGSPRGARLLHGSAGR